MEPVAQGIEHQPSKLGVAGSTPAGLASKLRHHVQSRGGLAKDANGEPIVPNGAWAMMLEAADMIEEAELARRSIRSLLSVYHERRSGQITSHKQFAFEIEFILAPSYKLSKPGQQ